MTNILEKFTNIASELPIIEAAETKSALPEIRTQAALDALLASLPQDEPIGLHFYPESCVYTMAVDGKAYVVNEFVADAIIAPKQGYTYVVPDAHDKACRALLKTHGITWPVESVQTQRNILTNGLKGKLSPVKPTTSLVSDFKKNKELLQQQGNLEWYEKLRDIQFLAEAPDFSYDHDKFRQILAGLKPEVQNQWTKLLTEFPIKVPVHMIPAGQVSGRFSTHAPNMQGLPKVLRPAFYIAPKKMWGLLAGDYKQIQPRILAALSGDVEWNRPFAEGMDFYKHCASAMFAKSIEDITDDERAVAKTISMGIIFGMGTKKMLEELAERGITGIDEDKAEELRSAFIGKFSALLEWRDNLPISKYAGKIEGDSAHRTLCLPSGRQIVYDAAEFSGQPLCSHLAQGIEADIVVNAILKFHKAVEEKAIEAHVVLVIHDELLVACRPTDAQTVRGMLAACMTEAFCEYPGMIPTENVVKISEPSVFWGAK